MGNVRELIARTIASPLMWAMALLITAMEVRSAFLPLEGLGPVATAGLMAEVVPEFCTAILYIAVLLSAPRIGSLARQGWLFVALPVLGVLGTLLCCAPGQEGAHPLVVLAGVVSVQVALGLLLLLSLELLSDMPAVQVRCVVVGASVANACVMAVVEGAPLLWSLGTLAAGSVALGLAWRQWCRGGCGSAFAPGQDRGDGTVRFPVALAVGLLVMVASFGFLQELLYQQEAPVVSSVVAGTKLAAVVIFIGTLTVLGDTNYATLARLIVTFTVAAFLVFLAQGSYSLLPSVVMNTGYSLLEMTTLLILAELAVTVRVRPLRLFATVYLIESVGYVAGYLLGAAPLGVAGFGLRSAAALLALGLLVCAVWVFTEKRVNEFLWGVPAPPVREGDEEVSRDETTPEADGFADGASGPYDARVAAVAERFRLSPREIEVLELFAAGRSAAFIAELQFVTTNTVRSHIKHIYGKCDVHSRQELITLIERQTVADGGPREGRI